ncbi:transcription elongation factor SPT4 SCDLUD_005254 [Saccharomycodes ludwigii]|uniref:transcription elongation factor SPT4 n=1 Tax=Saccharomycodes ludwigii TaxID=36035 RepID=UPI001E8AAD2C|nr:hypothetical protein SCDLUD_005254 [Saccharomycodes ludwigii]KAH3898910.1 hypothetical protein SCDLUD_005254 [Saccharomycodes ludwigii]
MSERACMLCGIIQKTSQFENKGCPNCQAIFDEANVTPIECTSPSFEGCIGMCKPNKSWCAKWLRLDNFQPGLYAIKVDGRLPVEVVDILPHYIPRDGSNVD